MAAGFDPYHRWLSIPPAEQPPDHYRLLGLQVFETSYAVIENAAARQSRHVRGHLETPLRPYATNLLREIEIARLCLLDREAKAAYDACLRQRQEYQGRADAKSISPAETDDGLSPSFPAESHSFSGPVPAIDTFRRYRPKRRRSSPLTFLVLWLSGGAMGLLAGYAVLCMIDPQYDFLHMMFPVERGDQSGLEAPIVPAVTAAKPEGRSIKVIPARVQDAPKRIAPVPSDLRKMLGVERPIPVGGRQGMQTESQIVADVAHEEVQPPTAIRELKPIELRFDLKKRVFRVVSMPDTILLEELRCNIHASPELGMVPLNNFPLGDKQEALFNTGLKGVVAGIEVSFLRRNKSVVVEIVPKYRLPSGDDEAWYKTGGIRKARLLTNQVSVATNARSAMPALQSDLARVKAEFESASRIANRPTPAGMFASQLAAQRRFPVLSEQGAALEKQIAEAAALSANLPILEADLAAVKRLGEWSGEMAESATLTVSIHCDGVGLDAEAR